MRDPDYGYLATAVVPCYFLVTVCAIRTGQVTCGMAGAAAAIGAAPMLVHGYLIVFVGSRLF